MANPAFHRPWAPPTPRVPTSPATRRRACSASAATTRRARKGRRRAGSWAWEEAPPAPARPTRSAKVPGRGTASVGRSERSATRSARRASPAPAPAPQPWRARRSTASSAERNLHLTDIVLRGSIRQMKGAWVPDQRRQRSRVGCPDFV